MFSNALYELQKPYFESLYFCWPGLFNLVVKQCCEGLLFECKVDEFVKCIFLISRVLMFSVNPLFHSSSLDNWSPSLIKFLKSFGCINVAPHSDQTGIIQPINCNLNSI